ncbi:MAG: DUF937 domain-containing protein [Robiginitomaculum sp.]|nr:DUF937 domain-containing protein [Robiginitomaculum sp.]
MAVQNLLDMIMQAQGGQVAQNAGSQLGLNAKQSQSAIAALLPAISSALKNNTGNPQGLQSLLGALQGGQHEQYLDKPDLYSGPNIRNQGNAILGKLFGSKEVSRAVAGRAAEKTGIGADILKKMLPILAMAVTGYMAKKAIGGGSGAGTGGGLGGGALGGILGSIVTGMMSR